MARLSAEPPAVVNDEWLLAPWQQDELDRNSQYKQQRSYGMISKTYRLTFVM